MKSFFTFQELLAFVVPLLIVYTYALFKLSFKEKADIVNTGDDGILITLGTVLLLGGMLMTILFALLSFSYMSYFDVSVLEKTYSYILLVLLVVPVFFFLFQYLNIKQYYVRKHLLSEPEPGLEIAILKRKIQKLSEDLRLKKPPNILVSAYQNLQPFVFGYGEKRSYLVISDNFDQLVSDRSLSKQQRDLLERFLYLHELSHVRNRDLGFISISSVLIRMIWPWLLVLFIAGQFFLTGYEHFVKITIFFYHLIFPILVFSYLLLLILYFTLSKNREYLADSRALLSLTPEETKQLIEVLSPPVGSGSSLFEYLLLRLKLRTEFVKGNDAGSKKTSPLKRIINKVIKKSHDLLSRIPLHPRDNHRFVGIKDKTVFYEQKVSPSKTSSIFFGIIIALVVNMLVNLNMFLIIYGEETNRKLNIYGDWSFFFLALILFFIPALFFNLPLTNSINKRIEPRHFISQFLKSHCWGLIAFTITSGILIGMNREFFLAVHVNHTKLSSFISVELLFLIILYICIMMLSFGTSYLIREKVFMEEKGEVVLISVITIGFFFALIFFLGSVYYGFPIHINILFSVVASLVFFLSQKFFSGGIINNKLILNFGKRGFVINYSKTNPVDMFLKFVFAGFVIGIVYLGSPLIVINHALFLFLRAFPNVNEYFPYIMILFTIIVIIAVFLKKPEYRLEELAQKALIAKELGIKLSGKFEEIIRKGLDQKRSPSGGYIVTKSYRLPFMESDYYGALLEDVLFGRVTEETLNRISGQQDENGGFRDHQKGTPNLESTFFAVDLLYRENRVSIIAGEKTTRWLIDQMKGAHSKKASLQKLFYVVGALTKLNKNAVSELEIKEDDVILLWDKSDKTIENFCYVSVILASISDQYHPFLEKLRGLWLDVFWKSILNTDIQASIRDLSLFLLGVRTLQPDNTEDIFESLRQRVTKLLK